MPKIILCLLCYLLSAQLVAAQTKGIAVKVLNAKNEALNYITVCLIKANDSRRYGLNLRYNFGFHKKEATDNMFNDPQDKIN